MGGDPAQGLSFRFQTHEQYSDVGMTTPRLLMSLCVDLPTEKGPDRGFVQLQAEDSTLKAVSDSFAVKKNNPDNVFITLITL